MKYEKLTPEEVKALTIEICESDWFFGEIYGELSIHIQNILKERGFLKMEEHDTVADACIQASDEIFNRICVFYALGKVDLAEIQSWQ